MLEGKKYMLPPGLQRPRTGKSYNECPGHWYCPCCGEFIDVREIDLENVPEHARIEFVTHAICAYCGKIASAVQEHSPELREELYEQIMSPTLYSHMYSFSKEGICLIEAHRRVGTKYQVWDISMLREDGLGVVSGTSITRAVQHMWTHLDVYRVLTCA